MINLCDIFVYTMGKVASSTISYSLWGSGIDCLDIHLLTPKRIYREINSRVDNGANEALPPHLISSLIANNSLLHFDRIKIITLIRDPVARNISAVFQNLPPAPTLNDKTVMDAIAAYNPHTPDLWFQTEFIPITGIDIFRETIDPTQSHFRFVNEKFDVLMLKIETPNPEKAKILSDFLGDEITIHDKNIAGQKWYGDKYKEIKENPSHLPEGFLKTALQQKYFEKFYPLPERKALWQHYLPPTPKITTPI